MAGSGPLPPGWTGLVPAQRPPTPSPGDFNLDANDVRVIRIPLDAANVSPGRLLNMTGNAIWAVDASSPNAAMRMRINHPYGDGIPVTEGFAMRTPNYQRIYFENVAQAGEWLDIVYWRSEWDFFVVNPGSVTANVSVAKPTAGENVRIALAPGVNTQVLAADATRRAVIIKNEGPDFVRIGWNPSATPLSDTIGIQLATGESITLEGTKRIDARVAAAGVASVVNAMSILD